MLLLNNSGMHDSENTTMAVIAPLTEFPPLFKSSTREETDDN